MGRSCTGEIRQNGPGHDLYFKSTFAQDTTNPFEGGDGYTALTLPGMGVLLLTESAVEQELPLDVTVTEADFDG